MDRLNKIERLKDRLYATDYIVLKEYEGLNVSEHGDFHNERQAIRDEINRLQSMTDEEYYEAYPEEINVQNDEDIETDSGNTEIE